MNYKEFFDLSNDKSKITITVVSLLVIILFVRAVVKQRKYNKMNPRFLKSGKDAKKEEVISNSLIYKSSNDIEFSLFTWLYIDNIVYKFGEWKHVLTKGNRGIMSEQQAPGIWIHPTKNVFLFRIKTNRGISNIFVDDFPIRKWFSMGLVLRNMNCEIYLDGKLERTVGLKGNPQFNNGDLIVNSEGGFAGVISSIACISYAISSYDMIKRHYGGPYGSSIGENILNWILRRTAAIRELVSLDNIKITDEGKLSIKYKPHHKKRWRFYEDKIPKFGDTGKKEKGKIGKEILNFHWCWNKDTSISLVDAKKKYEKTGFIAYISEKGMKKKSKDCKNPGIWIAGLKNTDGLDLTLQDYPEKDLKNMKQFGFNKIGWYVYE